MMYLLDTNICIYIIKKQPIKVIHKLRKLPVDKICISSITMSELEYGVQKSRNRLQNKIALAEFIVPFHILDYDDKAAFYYGRIRANLARRGKIPCVSNRGFVLPVLSILGSEFNTFVSISDPLSIQ